MRGRERKTYYRKEPKLGWPPSPRGNNTSSNATAPPQPSPFVHLVKYRIPHRCLNVGPKVFIKALAWAAIASSHLERFSDLEVIVEFALIFVAFVYHHCRFVPVDGFLTVFFVGSNTRVGPIASSRCSAVFFSSCKNGTGGLADVFCLV